MPLLGDIVKVIKKSKKTYNELTQGLAEHTATHDMEKDEREIADPDCFPINSEE